MEATKGVQANETCQVQLLYRDIDILRAEIADLRAWKGKTIGEVENLLELAVSNRESYVQAKVKSARGENAKERDMIFEAKVAARANENQYWVNRIESFLLKIK